MNIVTRIVSAWRLIVQDEAGAGLMRLERQNRMLVIKPRADDLVSSFAMSAAAGLFCGVGLPAIALYHAWGGENLWQALIFSLCMAVLGSVVAISSLTFNQVTLRLDSDRSQALLERRFVCKIERETLSFDILDTFELGQKDPETDRVPLWMHTKEGRAIGVGAFSPVEAWEAAQACRAALAGG